MKTRRSTVLAAIGILVILGLLLWPSAEPRYQNKPLSYWVNQIGSRQLGAYDQLRGAVTAIGPKGIPILFREIGREDSAWGKFYRWIWPTLPTIVHTKLPQPQSVDDPTAAQIGSIVGLVGVPALPFVTSALNDRSARVRLAAVVALGEIDPKPAEGVTFFSKMLKDPNGFIRVYAAVGLASMGTNAISAIPHLVAALKDSDVGPSSIVSPAPMPGAKPTTFASKVAVWANAAAALGRIGPDARAAVPELQKLVSDPESYVREQAAVALWRIEGATNGVAVLVVQLQSARFDVDCQRVLTELREMGVVAKGASSTVAKLSRAYDWPESGSFRKFDVTPDIRRLAREVLGKIDPEAAARIERENR